jgi:hypothetical protein
VCVYSLRAKERPTVSTPVTWQELQKALKTKNPEVLIFEADQVLRRVQKMGDLFASVLTLQQKSARVAARRSRCVKSGPRALFYCSIGEDPTEQAWNRKPLTLRENYNVLYRTKVILWGGWWLPPRRHLAK